LKFFPAPPTLVAGGALQDKFLKRIGRIRIGWAIAELEKHIRPLIYKNFVESLNRQSR
jgi:hypothetical protein